MVRKREIEVAGHLPTKQGLKQDLVDENGRQGYCCRASSNKTRIETYTSIIVKGLGVMVAGHLPTKQGLKPFSALSFFSVVFSCRASSNKTRIETPLWAQSSAAAAALQGIFQQNKD